MAVNVIRAYKLIMNVLSWVVMYIFVIFWVKNRVQQPWTGIKLKTAPLWVVYLIALSVMFCFRPSLQIMTKSTCRLAGLTRF